MGPVLCGAKAWGSFPDSNPSPGAWDPDFKPVSFSDALEKIFETRKIFIHSKM